ncbi:MAG: sigma-54-dependent Fis family transcriptional regulator [Deltaproteobacteria bacterium]|nr:sigma-54-dependent Fis family transcriptional regulator [Deltaproteobacteria bacterium]
MGAILVVDDERSMRDYLEILLRKAGHQVVAAANLQAARDALAQGDLDLVITDLKLGNESGLDLLTHVNEQRMPVELVVITAYATTDTAIEAMKKGAYDYLQKPFKNEELLVVVDKAIEKRRLVRENTALKRQLGQELIFGEATPIKEIRALVEKVAPGRTTVLIEGESGTGKELVARMLHQRSGRSGAFVAMNCGAMTAELVESELFGHVKGAFTGAVQASPGLFRAADGGTLFLDEIGELPPALQVKLLRVLQDRVVRPVGGTEGVAVDARIVAATNRSLEAEVAAGRFREDLFYRLNVVQLRVPPLRERPSDIVPLARHFVARFASELARPLMQLTPETERLLAGHSFPGNVRELENVVERAAALSDSDLIGPEALPAALRGAPATSPAELPAQLPESGFDLEAFLEATERRLILEALARTGSVRTEAAKLLGLSFRSIRYRIAKLGIDAGPERE